MIDRSRDLLDRAARRSAPGTKERLESTSRTLARAAGAVERLGPMKRGEDRSTRREH